MPDVCRSEGVEFLNGTEIASCIGHALASCCEARGTRPHDRTCHSLLCVVTGVKGSTMLFRVQLATMPVCEILMLDVHSRLDFLKTSGALVGTALLPGARENHSIAIQYKTLDSKVFGPICRGYRDSLSITVPQIASVVQAIQRRLGHTLDIGSHTAVTNPTYLLQVSLEGFDYSSLFMSTLVCRLAYELSNRNKHVVKTGRSVARCKTTPYWNAERVGAAAKAAMVLPFCARDVADQVLHALRLTNSGPRPNPDGGEIALEVRVERNPQTGHVTIVNSQKVVIPATRFPLSTAMLLS